MPVPDMLGLMDGSLAGVRIGIPRDYFFDVPELNADTRAACLAAIDLMTAAGATAVDVPFPHAEVARLASRVIMISEAYAYHEPDLQARPELYGKYTRQTIRQGAFVGGGDYVQANRVRSLVKTEAAAALADVDVLITPTMVNLAPRFEGYNPDSMLSARSFSGVWNLTGLPALSVCCGFSADQLPIGLQIVGKPFSEPMVFKVGDAYQSLTNWHTRLPEPSTSTVYA